MARKIKDLHPESEAELYKLMGIKSHYDAPSDEEYEKVFGKEIPGTYFVHQAFVWDYGFVSIYHMIAYCIYHNISMEEILGEEFTYPPEDAYY